MSVQNVSLKEYENIVNRCIGCNFCVENSWLGPYHGCPIFDVTGFESYGARGRNLIISLILKNDPNLKFDKKLTERVFSCADCGYCEEVCMTGLPLTELFRWLMNYALEHSENVPNSIKITFKRLLTKGNIFGKEIDQKYDWLDDKSILNRKDAEIIYFIGCTTLYNQTQIAKAVVSILKKTHANFTILCDEKCCGYPFYAMGDLKNGVKFTEENIQHFKQTNAKIVLFSCPGCMKTFIRDYENATKKHFPFKAIHILEYVNEYVKDRKIQFQLEKPLTVTFHDPCHLGRGLKIYDAPRELLGKIENLRLNEMTRSREKAYCCGGALTTSNPKIKEKVNEFRVKEAINTEPQMILQACPTCTLNFKKGVKKLGNNNITVKDIVELLDELL